MCNSKHKPTLDYTNKGRQYYLGGLTGFMVGRCRGEKMMYLKECPKCHGDLYLGGDMYGQFVSCIQCGYLHDMPVAKTQKPVRETMVIDAPNPAKRSRRKVRQAA